MTVGRFIACNIRLFLRTVTRTGTPLSEPVGRNTGFLLVEICTGMRLELLSSLSLDVSESFPSYWPITASTDDRVRGGGGGGEENRPPPSNSFPGHLGTV